MDLGILRKGVLYAFNEAPFPIPGTPEIVSHPSSACIKIIFSHSFIPSFLTAEWMLTVMGFFLTNCLGSG